MKKHVILLLLALPVSLLGQTISRGPYLQKLTSASVTIRWRTSSAVDAKVMYGTDVSNLDQSVIVSGNVTEHTAVITGLSAYTKYYYSIGTTTLKLQGDDQNNFLTAPVPGTEDKYTFWVTGDCGNNSTNQQNVRNAYNTYIGNKTTNGWLLLGDNAYNGGLDAEYTTGFFNIYQGSIMKHAPLWPSPGNHDYNNNATIQDSHNMPYYNIFDLPVNGEAGGVPSGSEAYYSYDYGNIHFMALDSYGEESNKRLYDTTGTQAQWVKQDLASNTKKWVIAYWHHPPYTMTSHNSDTEAELVSMRSNFIRILERYKVDLILCGHSHGYERSKLMKGHYGNEASFNAVTHNLSSSSGLYNGTANSCVYLKDSTHTYSGTVYVVAGSAGQLGGTQSTFPHNAMYYSDQSNGGSLVLEIEGNRLDAKWVCADGVIRDNFTMIKDANKVRSYVIDQGTSLNFTASWKGNYVWSQDGSNAASVTVTPAVSTTYIVTDQYKCVADTFKVMVNALAVPITLLSFNAKLNDDKQTEINWQTASEQLNKTFIVERSSDGITFSNIAVKQGSGSSSSLKSYMVIDRSPLPGNSYYRLKQIDSNGRSTYSYNVVIDNTSFVNGLKIHPNPATDLTDIEFATKEETDVNVSLYNFYGQLVSQQSITTIAGGNKVAFDVAALPAGIYQVIIHAAKDNKNLYASKLVKN